MTAADHSRIIAIGYAAFAAIFAFTFALLMLVSFGVFIGLGFSLSNESGDKNQAAVGLLGGVFAIIFYCVLGVIFVLPPALAGWKVWKRRRGARLWGMIAAILMLPVVPLGTAFGVYSLWFWSTPDGRNICRLPDNAKEAGDPR
jgi:hypothetical protein